MDGHLEKGYGRRFFGGFTKSKALMQPKLYYCYDAYCGWCYGFSKTIEQIAQEYSNRIIFDVLSGGMIPDENPKHISTIAPYVQTAYREVEKLTSIQFGADFLWHIFHPENSDWYPQSTTAAVALCIFKEYLPALAIKMAAALQYALNFEGRDLTDKEAYRHLLERYHLPEEDFFSKLQSPLYKQKAYDEFALVKQLDVTGFPSVLLQVSISKFYLLARGYTTLEVLKQRIDKVLGGHNREEPTVLPSHP
ncbi:MAG: hypothetical protein NVS1B13_00590 [Flavisolibacter sp.]